MLDTPIRRLIDHPLSILAAQFVRLGVSTDALTVAGFIVGVAGAADIAASHFFLGLGLIVLGRLFDGLDGAVARQTRQTNLGSFLSVTSNAIVWASLPFAFALADPSRSLAALFLMLGFIASGTARVAFSGFAARAGATPPVSFLSQLADLTGNTEILLAFALACVFPNWFSIMAYVFGVLCFVSAGARVAQAIVMLGEP